MGSGRLGEILVAEGLSPADLARGLAVARVEKTRVGSALVLLGLRSSDEVAMALSRQKGVAAARDKHLAAIAPGTRALLSAATARRLCAVPVGVVRGEPPALVVAMRDPDDAAALAELERETGYAVRPAVACEARLREAIELMGADPPRVEFAAPTISELTPVPRAIAPAIELPEPDALGPPPLSLEPLPSSPSFPASPDLGALPETIDLTPTTLDLPAPPLVRPSVSEAPLAPVLPPAKPITVSTDLELDGPVRAPAPPASRLALPATAPIGGSVLDEAPSRSGLPRWVITLGLLALLGGGGVLAWDYLHDDSPAPGTPLEGEFHSKRLDATLTLPGAGWIESPDWLGSMPKLANGGELHADLFARGDKAAPRNVLLVARISMDGAFAAVTPEQFQEAVDGIQQGVGRMISGGGFVLRGGTCTQDTIAGKPLGVCRSTAEARGTSYDLRFLFWIASSDDAMVLVYLDPTDAGAAVELAQSVRLD